MSSPAQSSAVYTVWGLLCESFYDADQSFHLPDNTPWNVPSVVTLTLSCKSITCPAKLSFSPPLLPATALLYVNVSASLRLCPFLSLSAGALIGHRDKGAQLDQQVAV